MTGPPLSEEETMRIREGVAAAVLTGPDGLGKALERDPESYLRLVAATRVGVEESSRLLREAVGGARGAGHSWDALGRLLGVSRQAAQQRFGLERPAEGIATVGAGGRERRVLVPLTAFTEMAALNREGRLGWHLVDFGPLHHVVEASDRVWEHRRMPFAVGSRLRRLEAEGWEPVGAWFPWRYLKRPIGRL
jgi:hypothetical protein